MKRKSKIETTLGVFSEKISSAFDDSELYLRKQAALNENELNMLTMFTQFLLTYSFLSGTIQPPRLTNIPSPQSFNETYQNYIAQPGYVHMCDSSLHHWETADRPRDRGTTHSRRLRVLNQTCFAGDLKFKTIQETKSGQNANPKTLKDLVKLTPVNERGMFKQRQHDALSSSGQ